MLGPKSAVLPQTSAPVTPGVLTVNMTDNVTGGKHVVHALQAIMTTSMYGHICGVNISRSGLAVLHPR